MMIPNSVKNLGSCAFELCSGLTNMMIPDSVMSIGSYAFEYCRGLRNVTIGKGTTNIGSGAFCNCDELTNVVIPDSVMSIGSYAFESCSGLTNVTIGRRVTDIGSCAFLNCGGLTNVVIPASVTNIGVRAFSSCGKLESIEVASENVNYKSKAGVLFSKDGSTLVSFPSGKSGAYNIPDGVTDIAMRAFFACSGLTSLSIPDSVTNVASYVFYKCSELKLLYVPSDWEGTSMLSEADIPSSCTVIYRGIGKRNIYLDVATNYPDGWTNGSNGGIGFGAWRIETQEGHGYYGWAGCGIWDPSLNEFAGTWKGKTNAFGMVGKEEGYFVTASRSFIRPLCIGDSFGLEMAVNRADWQEESTKGFVLMAEGRDAVTINHEGYFGTISVNGNTNYAILNMAGLYPMAWTFTVVDGTTLRFTATGRDNPANVCTGFLKVASSAIDAFRLQSIEQYARATDWEQTYYDNFRLDLALTPPVEISHSWMDKKVAGILAANGGDYEVAALATTSNGVNTVWECYVAGLEPEKKDSEFKVATSFENGEWKIAPDPDLNKGGTETNRIYTWEGAEVLDDETVWGPTNAASRFFRVKVALPEE